MYHKSNLAFGIGISPIRTEYIISYFVLRSLVPISCGKCFLKVTYDRYLNTGIPLHSDP